MKEKCGTPSLQQAKSIQRLGLVEAAGIEPASEKARSEKTTCVSSSVVSAATLDLARK
jgi:hypothetical protein